MKTFQIQRREVPQMKFTKKAQTYLYPIYIREDEKIIIQSTEEKIGKSWKRGFKVLTQEGTQIDFLPTLKQAKEKYST